MLFWEMIRRDAATLNTPSGVFRWLASHCPELWVRVQVGIGRSKRIVRDRVSGWKFRAADFERWKKGVQAIEAIASAREKGRPIPSSSRAIVDEFALRHLRYRLAPVGPESPRNDVAGRLQPYFVRPIRGERPVHSAVNEGRFDSPAVVMAYALLSIFEPNIVPIGGGKCPGCGRITGNTPKGKPRTGKCGRCKMADWRKENPDQAKEHALARKKKSATNSKGE